MRWNSTIISGLCLGGLALTFLLGIPTHVHLISVYADEASPRFFPYLTTGVMLLLSLYLVGSEWHRLRKAPPDEPKEADSQTAENTSTDASESNNEIRHVATAYSLVCLGVLAVQIVGFYIATTAILIGLMLIMGVRDMKVLLATACAWPLVLYIVFAKAFAMQFPIGGGV